MRKNLTVHCKTADDEKELRMRLKILTAIHGGTYYDVISEALALLEAGE